SASAIAWRVISSAALAVNAWLSASVTAGSSAMRSNPRTRSIIFFRASPPVRPRVSDAIVTAPFPEWRRSKTAPVACVPRSGAVRRRSRRPPGLSRAVQRLLPVAHHHGDDPQDDPEHRRAGGAAHDPEEQPVAEHAAHLHACTSPQPRRRGRPPRALG